MIRPLGGVIRELEEVLFDFFGCADESLGCWLFFGLFGFLAGVGLSETVSL